MKISKKQFANNIVPSIVEAFLSSKKLTVEQCAALRCDVCKMYSDDLLSDSVFESLLDRIDGAASLLSYHNDGGN